jgi:hypothetical protein
MRVGDQMCIHSDSAKCLCSSGPNRSNANRIAGFETKPAKPCNRVGRSNYDPVVGIDFGDESSKRCTGIGSVDNLNHWHHTNFGPAGFERANQLVGLRLSASYNNDWRLNAHVIWV